MKTGEILFLNREEVRRLITPEEVLRLVEDALKEYSEGRAVNPMKLSLPVWPYHEGHINSMPSYMAKGDIAGVKIVSVYVQNPSEYGLPTTIGTIVLHHPDTGVPYVVMDGTHITDLRTGAVSGIMAKYLAGKGAESLAIIGGGVQGFTSMQMILLSLPDIGCVRVCDLSEERCNSFIEKGKKQFPKVAFSRCEDHRQALEHSDITVYATSANGPLLEGGRVREGATVLCVSEKLTRKAIGLFDSWYVDVTDCAIDRYNDDGRHGAEVEGKIWEDLTSDLVTGEIGDVMTGKISGRKNGKEKILAGAVGMSIEDIAVAKAVYEAAVAKGTGKVLDFQNL